MRRERFDRDRGIHRDCGHPLEECSDPEREWFPQLSVCYATMEERSAQTRFDEIHKDRPWHDGSFPEDRAAWSDKRTAETPFRYDWGARVFVTDTDLDMGGDFLWQSVAEEGDGDDAEAEDPED